MSEFASLFRWVDHLFDHPVAEPAWHWAIGAPRWDDSAEGVATLIARTFENSGELLNRFSAEQLNQGFWYLVSNSCSSFMLSLADPEVPSSIQIRTLRSFVPLFEQVMAVRCTPHLSHVDETGVGPLNSACYMWWDILPICGCPGESSRAAFDAAAIQVLQRILAIPHDACRESALHGLGHWSLEYPSQVAEVIAQFLTDTPGLRPELIAYAEQARDGDIN